MGRTTYELGRTSLGSGIESVGAIEQLIETLELMHEHAEVEERSFHPTLITRARDVVERLEKDHETIDPRITAFLERARQFAETPDGPERAAAGHRLYLDFTALAATYDTHLYREETEGTPAFQAAFTDAELLEMQAKMRASMAPEKMARWATHMMAPLSHAERLGMLRGLKATAPAPILQGMLALAAKSLPKPDFERLEKELR